MQVIDRIRVDKNDIVVEAVILSIGNDRLIVVSGGLPHIGAISFGNKEQQENIALGTHKELAVTNKMFHSLKECCPDNLLITGGIHFDHITKEQIVLVMEICDMITLKIVELLGGSGKSKLLRKCKE